MSQSSISSIKKTFEDWSMYEAVIANDYMAHLELADGLKSVAAEMVEPLRTVDLGCGDAWLATHAFRGLPMKATWASIFRNQRLSAPGGTRSFGNRERN